MYIEVEYKHDGVHSKSAAKIFAIAILKGYINADGLLIYVISNLAKWLFAECRIATI